MPDTPSTSPADLAASISLSDLAGLPGLVAALRADHDAQARELKTLRANNDHLARLVLALAPGPSTASGGRPDGQAVLDLQDAGGAASSMSALRDKQSQTGEQQEDSKPEEDTNPPNPREDPTLQTLLRRVDEMSKEIAELKTRMSTDRPPPQPSGEDNSAPSAASSLLVTVLEARVLADTWGADITSFSFKLQFPYGTTEVSPRTPVLRTALDHTNSCSLQLRQRLQIPATYAARDALLVAERAHVLQDAIDATLQVAENLGEVLTSGLLGETWAKVSEKLRRMRKLCARLIAVLEPQKTT